MVGRLRGHSERAHLGDRGDLVGAGDDVDRDLAGLGVVLQQVEQDEAVDVVEAEIERDRVGPELARHRQRARAGGRDHALEARLAGEIEQDRGEGDVVLDDQHERIAAEIVAVVADLERRRAARSARVAPLFS